MAESAVDLLRRGASLRSTAKKLGVSRSTVHYWWTTSQATGSTTFSRCDVTPGSMVMGIEEVMAETGLSLLLIKRASLVIERITSRPIRSTALLDLETVLSNAAAILDFCKRRKRALLKYKSRMSARRARGAALRARRDELQTSWASAERVLEGDPSKSTEELVLMFPKLSPSYALERHAKWRSEHGLAPKSGKPLRVYLAWEDDARPLIAERPDITPSELQRLVPALCTLSRSAVGKWLHKEKSGTWKRPTSTAQS